MGLFLLGMKVIAVSAYKLAVCFSVGFFFSI